MTDACGGIQDQKNWGTKYLQEPVESLLAHSHYKVDAMEQ